MRFSYLLGESVDESEFVKRVGVSIAADIIVKSGFYTLFVCLWNSIHLCLNVSSAASAMSFVRSFFG
jgi:hypothetical protein